MNQKPKLGGWYSVSAEYVKRRTPLNQGFRFKNKKPFKTDFVRCSFEKPIKALCVGVRTVHNGYTGWDGDPDIDGGWQFERRSSLVVYLFVLDWRLNPIKVALEDIGEKHESPL